MLDLHEGVAELFAEAERSTERLFEAENFVWRMHYRVGRWSGVAIAPLPFPMSCRFCRRGVHCLQAHVVNCRSAPAWARSYRVEQRPKARPRIKPRAAGGEPQWLTRAERARLLEATG